VPADRPPADAAPQAEEPSPPPTRRERRRTRVEEYRERGQKTPIADIVERRRERGRPTPLADEYGIPPEEEEELEDEEDGEEENGDEENGEKEGPPYDPPGPEKYTDEQDRHWYWDYDKGTYVLKEPDEPELEQEEPGGDIDYGQEEDIGTKYVYGPEPGLEGGGYVTPEEPVIGETPTDIWGDEYGARIEEILSRGEEDEVQERVIQTETDRINRTFDDSAKRLQDKYASMGLNYSGAVMEELQDLEIERSQVVNQRVAELTNQALERDLQRKKMATDYALGSMAQNIRFSLGKGQLTLDQFQTAISEKLGISKLMLQQDIGNQQLQLGIMDQLFDYELGKARSETDRMQVMLNAAQLMAEIGLSQQQITERIMESIAQGQEPQYE
jgi:hypothetical protein